MGQHNFTGYQPAPQFGQSVGQFPPFTNIVLVDSLEQALRMPARMHSEMVYWNRYHDEIYRIYTDCANGKQFMVLDVKIQQKSKDENKALADTNSASTSDDRVSKLEDKVNKLLEVLNEKHNVNANGSSTNESVDSVSAK